MLSVYITIQTIHVDLVDSKRKIVSSLPFGISKLYVKQESYSLSSRWAQIVKGIGIKYLNLFCRVFIHFLFFLFFEWEKDIYYERRKEEEQNCIMTISLRAFAVSPPSNVVDSLNQCDSIFMFLSSALLSVRTFFDFFAFHRFLLGNASIT